MLRNPYNEEYRARRARLGMGTSAPIVRAVSKITREARPERLEVGAQPYISQVTYLKDGMTGRVVDMPNAITWRNIVAETAKKYGQTVKAIMGPNQMPHTSKARQECFYRMAQELGYGHSQIGRLIGNRDHSTVYKGIRRHLNRIEVATGISAPPPPNYGVALKPHSYEALESVATLKEQGKSYKEIQEATGFTPSQAPSMYRRWIRMQETMK